MTAPPAPATHEDRLSAFVVGLTASSIPPLTLHRARQHVLDAIACGLAGRHAEGREEVATVAARVFGAGDSSVIAGTPLAPGGAALVNGFQIAAPTLGDVHRATLTHVMPEVLPATLAAAQLNRSSGADVLAGVVAGMEVAVRVALALDTPAYRGRGWHNPGIAGAIGAACGAARVRGLDAPGVRMAIGHAASQAAGTFAALGTSGVKLHQARGGVAGLLAAELAASGMDASASALTAERGGLLASYADGGEPGRLTDGLGETWALESVALRRWPGASSLQPVIDGVLALRGELGRSGHGADVLGGVEAVEVDLPPRAFSLNGGSKWDTRLAALQSARWTAAVALADGEVWLDQTADARRADPAVASFAAERVAVAEDGSLPETGARVAIRRRDGTRLELVVEVPPGDPRRPLEDAVIVDKLVRAASTAGLPGRAEAIVEAVASLEDASSIQGLIDLLRAGPV